MYESEQNGVHFYTENREQRTESREQRAKNMSVEAYASDKPEDDTNKEWDQ